MCREDRSEADVVRTIGLSLSCLDQRRCRRTQDRIRAEYASRVGNREISLAEVSAVGYDSEREVEAIIDEQRCAEITANRRNAPSLVELVPHRAHFLPKLNDIGTAAQCEPGEVGVAEALLEVKICQDVQPTYAIFSSRSHGYDCVRAPNARCCSVDLFPCMEITS